MALTLLLADDSPTIAKILTLALAQDNYAITAVLNANDAMREILKKPELFLIDISLPEKDAFAFTKEIRANADLNSIKIIFLANSFDPVDEASCKAAGANAVITKPFDPAELRRKLQEVYHSAPVSPPPPSVATISSPPPPAAEKNLPTPPPPTAVSTAPPPEEEELSQNAKELASFFAQEITVNEIITEATKSIPAPAEMAAEESALDLSSALLDWSPTNPAITPAKDSLQQWTSPSTTTKPKSFDTGNSTFRFSADYVHKITKAFESNNDLERQLAETPETRTETRAKSEHPKKSPEVAAHEPETSEEIHEQLQSETDARAREDLDRLLEGRGTIKEAVLTESLAATAAPATATHFLDRQEMEEVIRDEVRLVCKAVVERIAWEVIPELAENIIRQELDKVMKELEP